jgi:AbrB family looped-hinge helix DNA binding protein
MGKVTSKRQVTIPKAMADQYGIEPGDVIDWVPAGEEIRMVVSGRTSSRALTVEERLRLFDQATDRRDARTDPEPTTPEEAERGWTREELYDRGRPG